MISAIKGAKLEIDVGDCITKIYIYILEKSVRIQPTEIAILLMNQHT